MNTTMIDRYLTEGLINLGQHQAGEYILAQAAKAGVWPTGANLSGTRIQDKKRDWSPVNAFSLFRTLAGVYQNLGWFHSQLIVEVVIRDLDVSKSSMRMICLREALDWIMKRRMGGYTDPLESLKRASDRVTKEW